MKLVLWAALLAAISCPFIANAQQQRAHTAADSLAARIVCGPFFVSEPSEPIASLDELPDYVRYKLISHLQRRLSPTFYAQLHFLKGKQIDLDSILRRRNDYKWTVCSYYLCYAFQNPAIGENEYVARIGLDKWGQPIDEITLPETKGQPEKEHIITRADALSIARRKGIIRKNERPEDVYSEVSYAPSLDILRWIITVRKRKTDYTSDIRTIILNAHNGDVLRIRKYEQRQTF